MFRARGVCHRDSSCQVGLPLIRLLSSSEIDGPYVVTTGDLARKKEVFFANGVRALPQACREVARRIRRHLDSLIESKSVNVQHLNGDAREVRQLLSDRGNPFAKSILDGGEFSNLTPVIRVDTERFRIAKLFTNSVSDDPKGETQGEEM